MDKLKGASLRLSRVTRAIEGDADPNANLGHCVNCGEWDILNRRDMCGDAVCRGSRAQRALDQDPAAGMVFNGNTYIVKERLRDALPACLPADKAVSNTARRNEVIKASELTQCDMKDLRGELPYHQTKEIETHMSTEAIVPICSHDGCHDCTRVGDSLCVNHRFEANELGRKLNSYAVSFVPDAPLVRPRRAKKRKYIHTYTHTDTHLKPMRATGAGLHGGFETTRATVNEIDSRSRAIGPDHTTRSRKPSKETLIELICLNGNPQPAVVKMLAKEYQEDIGESVVTYMLKNCHDEAEIHKVLASVVKVMEEIK